MLQNTDAPGDMSGSVRFRECSKLARISHMAENATDMEQTARWIGELADVSESVTDMAQTAGRTGELTDVAGGMCYIPSVGENVIEGSLGTKVLDAYDSFWHAYLKKGDIKMVNNAANKIRSKQKRF